MKLQVFFERTVIAKQCGSNMQCQRWNATDRARQWRQVLSMQQLFTRARHVVDLYLFTSVTFWPSYGSCAVPSCCYPKRRYRSVSSGTTVSLDFLVLGRSFGAGVSTRAAELVVSYPAVAHAFNVIVHFWRGVVVSCVAYSCSTCLQRYRSFLWRSCRILLLLGSQRACGNHVSENGVHPRSDARTEHWPAFLGQQSGTKSMESMMRGLPIQFPPAAKPKESFGVGTGFVHPADSPEGQECANLQSQAWAARERRNARTTVWEPW